jgi:serine/threonine-protein kinase
MITLAENVVIAERFRLIRLIGRGGMGSVWQARHLGLDTDCAVKFIEGEFASSPEAKIRFEREAKAAAQLRSPHVVQIFDHGVFEDTPYIAMELLRGQDLSQKLQSSGGRLAPGDVGQIIVQVCRALTKAHQAGIVHRDLKPENIWIAREDDGSGEERDIVKVLDFGIAKQKSEGISTTTKTGSMLGTPYYMSPEQAQGVKAVDSRADLWGLAVIVFQCITGRLPFESDALGDLLLKIIVNPLPVPSQVHASIPPGFDRWWAKAASRDPAGRYQTAKEFSDSLMFALGVTERRPGAPVPHAPPPTAGHTQVSPPPNMPGGMHATPHPNYVPPQLGTATPGASQLAHSAIAPMNATPNPMRPVQASVPGFGQTFNGAEAPAGIPPKKSGVGVAIGAVALLAVIAGIGAGVAVVKSKGSKDVASGSSGATTTTATATETATATATATTTATGADTAATAVASADTKPVDTKPADTKPADTKAGGGPVVLGGPKGTAAPVVTGAASGKPVASAKPAASASGRPAGGGDKWGF